MRTDTQQYFTRSAFGNIAVMLALAMLAWWLLGLQRAPWPSATPLLQPRVIAAIASVLFIVFCGWMLWPHRIDYPATATGTGLSDWHIAYASQTGFALELAQRTADTLRDAGNNASLHDIATLDAKQLAHGDWLFAVSTTGEGDPPDHALSFTGHILSTSTDLSGMRYAVLALGDSSYVNYCAFGHQLDAWLRQNHAQPLFDRIDVDNADPASLRRWQHHIGVLIGRTDQPDWERPHYQQWTLAERVLLNPGSPGGPAYHLVLTPPPDTPLNWVAGDIAEIGPRNAPAMVGTLLGDSTSAGDAVIEFQNRRMPLSEALARAQLPAADVLRGLAADAVAARLEPLPHREYSIASIPGDGNLQLLVRLMQRADGSPGIGSGWLCTHAAIGSAIDLRIRSNPNFHPPSAAAPMILIGNGTGLAGLRAHLKARIAAGAHRNWLLFGERTQAHDSFHADELDAWLAAGQLTHLDRVFSRDGGAHRYVQDLLLAHGERLRAWLDDGAAIHVCGSLEGMAPGVDAALATLVGKERVDTLLAAGRYRRDVY